MPRLNLTEEERLERIREQSRKAAARYRATPKGKAKQKEYNKSDARKESLHKYNTSEKRKIISKQYALTDKGKATHKKASAKFKSSVKGRAYYRAYQKTDEYKVWKNKYKRDRYQNDIEYQIETKLRNRIKDILRKYNSNKKDKTVALLGCSIKFFIKHIESQFEEGMAWENYGFETWHIDHIIPCNSFDLSKEEEQKKCFHYTNLQPLLAIDNLKKGSKLP